MESMLHQVIFLLNITVVVLGSVMRLPQIIKLYRAKSSEGISIWANLVDLTWCVIKLVKHHFNAYSLQLHDWTRLWIQLRLSRACLC